MKLSFIKIALLFLILSISFYVYKNKNTEEVRTLTSSKIIENTSKKTISPIRENSKEKDSVKKSISAETTSLFVPYWTFDEEIGDEEVTTLIYFGVAADKQGINRDDPGYKNLTRFVEYAGSKKKYLTIRMLETEANIAILENPQLQNKLITEVSALVSQYRFDGIVLDLELSVLPFNDVKQNINGFIELFEKETKKQNKHFAVAIYGDVFYRARPFDVSFISQHSDELIIMAYDFSKSYGEPGPNFPFSGKEKFGYDFQTMIIDYQKTVAPEKLTVTFGMFGYDWSLGSEGKPLKAAQSLTVHQAKSRYLNNCSLPNCKVTRNLNTKETNVTFKDSEGNNHEVWFEDEQSVEVKKKFLEERGIDNISYWAYGYW